jgi:nucleoside permease NupC
VLSAGLVVFLGVALILVKLPRRWMLRALHYDVALDLAASALVLLIHWGTFSGVMAATIAGLLMSVATSGLKSLFGYIHRNTYYPGAFRLQI